jgi:hypothetical protein
MLPTPRIMCFPASFAKLFTLALAAFPLACAPSASPGSGDANTSDAQVGCTPADGDLYIPGMTKTSAAQRFSFELVSSDPAPPALDDNRFVVRVADADGTPRSGELEVTLEMPQHGHSSPTAPQIRFDAADKTFTLAPLRLFMVGSWRFTFTFTPDSGPSPVIAGDSAVFQFCVD